MTESECLARMVPPGAVRRAKFGGGVIQILVTHSCTLACVNCTQGSNLAAPRWEMTPEQFRTACRSLKDYHGVVGMFGGCPSVHTKFTELCKVMREEIPYERRGLWCNDPTTVEKAKVMAQTFNPRVSNLNVHMNRRAHATFLQGWPELARHPGNFFGLEQDSRHAPVFVSMKDLDELPEFNAQHRHVANRPNTEENRHRLISDCDINQHWSAAVGVFRGELRAWFCEIAMSQSIHHQHDPEYPDTGLDPTMMYEAHVRPPGDERLETTLNHWWQLGMTSYAGQVRKHCHECGVPLRGHGSLAVDEAGTEHVSATHAAVYKPKKQGRAVELVTTLAQLGAPLTSATNYLGNARV